jgi:hypothetical protein
VLILADNNTGAPLVVELALPWLTMTVVDISDVHVVVAIDDPRSPKQPPVRLVMNYENGGRLASVITEAIRPRAKAEVIDMPVTHDIRCDCGSCPLRPVPASDEVSPDK